jgi:hypothetical protein
MVISRVGKIQHEKIELNTAPWIETRNERGGIVLTRDEESSRWTEVEKTDAWNDDGGRGAYRLSIKIGIGGD